MDEDLRKKIEAVLFSIGKKVNIKEIMRMIKEKDKGKVVACLIELKNKYDTDPHNSLMILQDGEDWKLTIRDQYIDVAKEIGVETELSKTIMETLAVIAYKNPVLQSNVIKIRTNKAYDHLIELENLGYISREKQGRTKLIKLAPKFFEYFDLPPESLKEKFKTVTDMEHAIQEKERQVHDIHELKKDKIEQQKKEDEEREKKNIYMEKVDNGALNKVLVGKEDHIQIIEQEKLGELEVFDEENVEIPPEKQEVSTEEKQTKKDEDNLLLTGEKLGEFAIYKEPDNYIEPGMDNSQVKEEKNNAAQKVEPKQNDSVPNLENEDIYGKGNESAIKIEAEVINIQGLKESINSRGIGRTLEEPETQISDSTQKENYHKQAVHEEHKNTEAKKEIMEHGAKEAEETVEVVEEDSFERDYEEGLNLLKKEKKPKLKEDQLFEMKGIPKDIEQKIEEKAEEIMGEK